MAKKQNQSPPKNFEDALAELEQILSQIEGGECGLEESLVKYERGTFLIQHCRTVLNAAEQQIEELTKSTDAAPAAGEAPSSTTTPAPIYPAAPR